MSKETFERPSVLDESNPLEPAAERVDSASPPEAYRAEQQRQYDEVRRALEGIKQALAYNSTVGMVTPESFRRRYRELIEQERKLRRQLDPAAQLDAFRDSAEVGPSPAPRAV